MIRSNATYILILGLIILLQGCKGEEVYFQKFESISNASWRADEPVSFDFEISDTNQVYEFYFNLRIGNNYQYSNFFNFWELKSPDGKVKTKIDEFILAKPSGQWLGKSASGTVIENQMFFLRKRLPAKGTYTFTFTQGMREEVLGNIKDVGLKIKRYNEQK